MRPSIGIPLKGSTGARPRSLGPLVLVVDGLADAEAVGHTLRIHLRGEGPPGRRARAMSAMESMASEDDDVVCGGR